MKNDKENQPVQLSVEEQKRQLKNLADAVLLSRRNRKKRPVLIEFAGSPKSGKSSSCNALDLFLRRNGFKTRVVTERSHFARIKNKRDPMFNLWTMSSTIAEIADIFGSTCSCDEPDVILVDRGIFDSLCWFNWLKSEKKLDSTNFDCIEKYLLMPKWKNLVDMVFVFKSEPGDSIRREFAQMLTDERGSIMHEKVLTAFNRSIDECFKKYKPEFGVVSLINTSNSKDLRPLNYKVTSRVLKILALGIEEKIAYVNKNVLKGGLPNVFKFQDAGITMSSVDFGRRVDVEKDEDKVQLVPIAVIFNKESSSILTATKTDIAADASNPEHKKLLTYFGGHIRGEDQTRTANQTIFNLMENALKRELEEELGIIHAPTFTGQSMAIWLQNQGSSGKHLAVCYFYQVNFDEFKFDFDPLEFNSSRKDSNHSKEAAIMDKNTLSLHSTFLEAWGREIVERLWGSNYQYEELGPLFKKMESN